MASASVGSPQYLTPNYSPFGGGQSNLSGQYGSIDPNALNNLLNQNVNLQQYSSLDPDQQKSYLQGILTSQGGINPDDLKKSPGLQSLINNVINNQQQTGPLTNANVSSRLQAQNAQQFNSNLPQMQQQLASQLAQASSASNNQGNRQITTANNARGLGYGGVNAGMKMQNSSNNAGLLANSISSANAGLQNQATQMTANAIGSGTAVQQNEQQIQNDIYQQAIASQQGNNALVGGLLQAGITGGIIAAL